MGLSMDLLHYSCFWLIALVHFGLAGFVLTRMFARPAIPAEAQSPFVAVPEAGQLSFS